MSVACGVAYGALLPPEPAPAECRVTRRTSADPATASRRVPLSQNTAACWRRAVSKGPLSNPLLRGTKPAAFLHCNPQPPWTVQERRTCVWKAVSEASQRSGSSRFPTTEDLGLSKTLGKWLSHPCHVVQEAARDQSPGPTEHSPLHPTSPPGPLGHQNDNVLTVSIVSISGSLLAVDQRKTGLFEQTSNCVAFFIFLLPGLSETKRRVACPYSEPDRSIPLIVLRKHPPSRPSIASYRIPAHYI
jgi:hypothetical protein